MDLALQQDSDSSQHAFTNMIDTPYFNNYLKHQEKTYEKKHTVAVIKTLLYLDREACDFHLNKQHITPCMLEKLHLFREQKTSLSENKMNLLWTITQLDPTHEINDNEITPDLIRHVEIMQKQNLEITKERLINVIQRDVLRRAQPSLPSVFLDLCSSLPTQEDTLLHAFCHDYSDQPAPKISQQNVFTEARRKVRLVTFDSIEKQPLDFNGKFK